MADHAVRAGHVHRPGLQPSVPARPGENRLSFASSLFIERSEQVPEPLRFDLTIQCELDGDGQRHR